MSDPPGAAETGYAYIWEYLVKPEAVAEFESIYGPDGDWVALFRRHEGYVRTELFEDQQRPGRYVTVDRWRSRAAYQAFRAAFAEQFEALDERCEALTLRETSLGEFATRGRGADLD